MELRQLMEFTPEMIINVVAVIASLLASYFPALSTWYAGLKSEVKSGIMIGSMAIVTVTVFLLTKYELITSANPITWQQAVYAFLQALIFNAGTYVFSPQTSKVKQIKAYRNLDAG